MSAICATSKIGFVPAGDRRQAQLRVVVFYADGNQKYLGSDWKTMDLNLREDTYQGFLRSGIPVTILIPLKAPDQILKVVLYDTGGDRTGSKLIRVR